MKVYMTGLVYMTGCDDPDGMRAYAPVGTGHYASLWVEAPQLDEANTEWWPELRRPARIVDGVGLVEFEIPDPAVIRFPGEGAVQCIDLDDGLPKLKKKKKKVKDDDPDHPEEEFEVAPAIAQTNAVVEMHGGTVRPRRLGNIGLVEWTISAPGLAIVVSRDDPNESKSITLNAANGDVAFLNMHELPNAYGPKDLLRGHHEAHFENLNPDPNVDIYTADAKAPGKAGQLVNVSFAALEFIRNGGCSCGNTPCCC